MPKPRIKKVRKPGIYDIPADLYHLDPCPSPSLSATIAKVLVSRSPMHAHYQHPKLNPNRPTDDKEAFDVGKAAHDALLEGVNRIEVIKADSWRTNAAKEQRDAARAKGLIPLLEKNYDRVAVMVQIANTAIANCEDLSGITLEDGKPELTLCWQDTGTWCRSRLDWLANDHSLIIDYKTTSGSAEPNDVTRTHVVTNGWDLQAAFYLRGLRAVSDKVKPPIVIARDDGRLLDYPDIKPGQIIQRPRPDNDLRVIRRDAKFVFLAQEIDPPYACSFIGMPPSFLALGEQKVNDAIRIWSECLRTDKWPAYPTRICYPETPAWAESRYVEKRSAGLGPSGMSLYEHLFGKENTDV